MDEGRTNLKTFHCEGEEAQLVQENFLVVKCELSSVRLRSNSPLDIPAVSEYKHQVLRLKYFPRFASLEKVLSFLLHALCGLPAKYY